jgi:hypothetical protein
MKDCDCFIASGVIRHATNRGEPCFPFSVAVPLFTLKETSILMSQKSSFLPEYKFLNSVQDSSHFFVLVGEGLERWASCLQRCGSII